MINMTEKKDGEDKDTRAEENIVKHEETPKDKAILEKKEKIFRNLQKEFISKKIGLYIFLGVILLTVGIIVILNHIGSKKQTSRQKSRYVSPETKHHLEKQKKNMNQMLNIPPVNAPQTVPSVPSSPEIKRAITKIKNNPHSGETQLPKMSLREKLKLKAFISPIISGETNSENSALSSITSQINALKNMKPFNPTSALAKIPEIEKKRLQQQNLLNLQKTNPNQAFIARAKTKKTIFTQVETPVKPVSEYEVEEGTIIPAVLMTKIDSNLPGMIKAQVVQNVYSYNGRYLEIPKGSFIIGEYSSQITANQSRLLVAFNVLELPNGDQVNLKGSEGVNGVGEVGFHDLVNTHFWQMFGTSLLLSIINVGSQIYGYNSGNMGSSAYGTSSPVTSSGVLLQGGSQALSTTGQNILQKYTNIPPTIIIRQGYRFNVFVAKNMVIKPYK